MEINRVILVGRLTQDPDMRTTGTGMPVVRFTLAVNRVWRDKEGAKKEEVSFFDCVAFGRTAEVVKEYTSKGKQIAVDGRLHQNRWTDQQSGQNRSKIEINVENLQLLGGKGDGESRGSKKENSFYAEDSGMTPPPFQGDDDDIPF